MTNDTDDRLKTGGGMKFLQEDLVAKQEGQLIGREIGGYKLQSRIGEGGMGVVFHASRNDDQFDRDVAIKLVSGFPATVQFDKRFARERQIHARLNHPFIAQLFDAGVTEEGWPYLVMELVHGDAIDDYCQANASNLEERVELLSKVCSAVAFAHANLIIHRDIKPSNILVDADGNPKLLDFGIAKLLEDESGELSVDARPMTPNYASTEQILGQPITIASDVFQLGALMCKVLSGKPAFKSNTLKDALQRATGDAELSLPTDILKSLPAELTAIIAKCLQSQPSDRYSDVNALREDLNRYLDGFPVLAQHPTAWRRFGKLVRRNPGISAVTAAALAIMVVGNYWYTARLAESRDAAEADAVRASAVSDFLVEMFSAAAPGQSQGEEVTAKALLDTGAEKLETELADQPEILAALQVTIGRSYRSLSLYSEARPLLDSALALAESNPDNRVQLARAILDRADLWGEEGEYQTAEPEFRRALATVADQDIPELEAEIQLSLGFNLYYLGRYVEAESHMRTSVDLYRQALGDEHRATVDAIGILAYITLSAGKVDEAAELFQQVLSIQRRLFKEPHSDLPTTLNNLGLLEKEYRTNPQAALPYFQEAVAITRQVMGDVHLATGVALTNLGATFMDLLSYEEAEESLLESLEIARQLVQKTHPLHSKNLELLGLLYMRQEEFEQAEQMVREGVRLARLGQGADHPTVAFSENNLARLLSRMGNHAEAKVLLEHAVQVVKERLGEDDPRILMIVANQASTALKLGNMTQAELLSQEVIAAAENLPVENRRRLSGAWATLGNIRVENQEFAEGESFLLQAYDMAQDSDSIERWKVEELLQDIIAMYEAWGRTEEVASYRELINRV